MKRADQKVLAARKRNLARPLDRWNYPRESGPVFAGGNVRYEMSDRVAAVGCGGIGAIHAMVQALGLDAAINGSVRLLNLHAPYHESDHVLNLAYNILTGGDCVEDLERLRENETYMDGIGAERIPDPTTAGDFCRRFDEGSLVALQEAVNDVREQVWALQDESFFEQALLDVDATIAETDGECKEGMGLSYKGIWGYAPLMVSLANTREPLYLINRSGNTPSCVDAVRWIDRAVARVSKKFKKILVRGDADYSLTEKFDEWDEKVEFVFGYPAMPNLVAKADALPDSAWARLERAAKYEVKTQERTRLENVKKKIVRENGYKNIRLVCEDVAEFAYRPAKCKKTYRMVVVRKNLSVEEGEAVLLPEIRYFFYIANNRVRPQEEIVFEANKRCDQENLFGQFHSGLSAMRMPLNSLHSNWAYMVIAALAWTLKAWYGLLVPDETESKKVVRMEFKKFLHRFVMIPCQILKHGRRLIYRIANFNHALRTFFDTFAAIRKLRFT
ncbi:MAG: IS1380 family transposase [bacterium]